jgi:pyruvate dehydrogenase E2 component (dihydrolipoamide acetyltransferase)
MTDIVKVGMPKWGLSMTEGRVLDWLVNEGDDVAQGDELAEAESEKIAGEIEAPTNGVLRRRVAGVGDMVPVGGLVGVIAPADVSDDDIDAFIADFQERFVPPEEAEDAGPSPLAAAVDGRDLRYLRLGEREASPIVFVHGFGGDLNNWLFTTEKLSQQRPTYALDLPGHGASHKDVSSFDELVAALAGFLDAVELDRVHLVGHSVGGAVAVRVAAQHPDRVTSLTLIDSAGLGPDINADYVDGFVEANGRRDLKGVLQLLFADPSLVTRRMVDDVLKYKRKDGVDAALRALAGDMFPDGAQSVDLRAELAALDVPVLVVWGEQDQVIPASHAAGLPDEVVVHLLDGQGHSPHMEAANEVNRLIGQVVNA